MGFPQNYLDIATPLGEKILTWARPDWQAPNVHPQAGAFGTDFETAFAIALGYLVFVIFGRMIMEILPAVNSKALHPYKFAYNISQVMLCSYMAIEAFVRAYQAGYTITPCQPFNQERPEIGFILYIFYLSKILDFADTFFIIVTKSWKQLTFLHVYHHFSIFLFYWLNINVGYDGDVFLTIILNGCIHTIMYVYYFVSLHTKDIPWKSALTMSQMVQFVCMNAQAAHLIYFNCQTFPRNITVAYLYYIMTLLFLFAQFYVASYGDKKEDKSAIVASEIEALEEQIKELKKKKN